MEDVKNEVALNTSHLIANFGDLKNLEEKLKKEHKDALYATKNFIYKISECLLPVLKGRHVANKWSEDISYYMNLSIKSIGEPDELAEMYLLDNINLNTYSNSFKTVIDNTCLLLGKILLQHNISNLETEKLMLQIESGLYDIDHISMFLDSWLYDEAEFTNSTDYANLCDVVTGAKEEFSAICDEYKNTNFTHIDLAEIPSYAVTQIEKTSSIYEKILVLSSKIVQLDFDDKLSPYLYIFKQFGKELANTLFYLAGLAYIDVGCENYNEFKTRNLILRHLDKLEQSCSRYQYDLYYVLNELKEDCNYGSNNDREVFYAYQELKKTIKNTFFSSWE